MSASFQVTFTVHTQSPYSTLIFTFVFARSGRIRKIIARTQPTTKPAESCLELGRGSLERLSRSILLIEDSESFRSFVAGHDFSGERDARLYDSAS